MVESEFKQWFSGFMEGIGDKVPTAKQWAKIKERVGQITGTPVVYQTFYERYWHPYYNGPYYAYSVSGDATKMLAGSARSSDGAQNAMSLAQSGAGEWLEQARSFGQNYAGGDGISYEPAFDANDAMYALGRADATAT